jgi:hypothetical protein
MSDRVWAFVVMATGWSISAALIWFARRLK